MSNNENLITIKTKKLSFAIIAMAIVAIAVAVVSCKKDNENAMNNKTESARTFNPRLIEDMNAYLQGFKLKMQTTAKTDETLTLEEAAWHLASLANYDFAKASENYNNLRFDTLHSTIKVTGDIVLLRDLAVAYECISKSISEFEKSIMLVDQGLYFIDVEITETGELSVSIITTFTDGTKYLEDTCYYFEDWFEAYSDCYNYFDDFTTLPVQSTGTSELKRVINLIANRAPMPGYYFTPTSTLTFYFNQNIDPNGSPSLWNSRLYASAFNFVYYDLLVDDEICYYLDSYLGLGVNARPANDYIIGWNLQLITDDLINNTPIQRHVLTVKYGERHPISSEPGGGNFK